MTEKSEFSWTLKRPFYFEAYEPMQDVIHTLKTLTGSDSVGFGKMPDIITFKPTSNGYSFHYEIRRWGKYSRSSMTAYGDGEIWQHTNGTIVIEGTAQIDLWGFYGAMIVSVLLCFGMVVSATIHPFIGVLLMLGFMLFIAFIYIDDRNRVSELIAQVLSPVDQGE